MRGAVFGWDLACYLNVCCGMVKLCGCAEVVVI